MLCYAHARQQLFCLIWNDWPARGSVSRRVVRIYTYPASLSFVIPSHLLVLIIVVLLSLGFLVSAFEVRLECIFFIYA